MCRVDVSKSETLRKYGNSLLLWEEGDEYDTILIPKNHIVNSQKEIEDISSYVYERTCCCCLECKFFEPTPILNRTDKNMTIFMGDVYDEDEYTEEIINNNDEDKKFITIEIEKKKQ